MNHSNQPVLSAIVAMGENRVIGKDNQLPWRLPADLKHFKSITTGHPIVMGRKTFESIGKALPNRLNIVLTRDAAYQAPGCIVVTTIDDALIQAQALEVFIIGGAEVYKQLLPRIHRIYLTIVHHDFDGDAFFPVFDEQEWKEVDKVRHEPDADNAYAYSFVTLERKL